MPRGSGGLDGLGEGEVVGSGNLLGEGEAIIKGVLIRGIWGVKIRGCAIED